jgi:hypothetical protein
MRRILVTVTCSGVNLTEYATDPLLILCLFNSSVNCNGSIASNEGIIVHQ